MRFNAISYTGVGSCNCLFVLGFVRASYQINGTAPHFLFGDNLTIEEQSGNKSFIAMKRFLIIISLLCVCSVYSYAQTSSNDKKANREKRKTERLIRRAEKQKKRLKNKTETNQEDFVVKVEQEQPTTTNNDGDSYDIAVKSQDDVHNPATQEVEIAISKEESKTQSINLSTPTKNKNIETTEPAKAPQTDSNDTAVTIFIIIVVSIIAVPIMILKWIFSGRCKKCGKLRAMRTIDEQYLGRSKTKMEKDNQGKFYQVHYNNIKVIQRCRHCGYTTTHVEERKG